MPRAARIVMPGFPHHVTHRGNNQDDIFLEHDDRVKYLRLLKRQCAEHDVAVEGFCLMTNHVHLILTPKCEKGLARAIGRTHHQYTLYFNRLHGRSGHLWQNRFFSCALDDAHFLAAMRYVETNPVRARIVSAPWKYTWSSAREHLGASPPVRLLNIERWQALSEGLSWSAFLLDTCVDADDRLRIATQGGKPLLGAGGQSPRFAECKDSRSSATDSETR